MLARLRLAMELARWRAAGERVQLWWRDDDVREPSAPLDRLLGLSADAGVPITLAAIPDPQSVYLAPSLSGHGQACLVQHGVDHQNRRLGRTAGEFPHDWSRLRLATQLRVGWSRLELLPGAFHGFVPPWNDVHPELASALGDCGYAVWSAWGQDAPGGPPEGPPRVDAHIDLLRWKKGVRFRGAARFHDGLSRALARRRREGRWAAPVGILTHHLDHDEDAWAFLSDFLRETAADPVFQWRDFRDLAAEAAAAEAQA